MESIELNIGRRIQAIRVRGRMTQASFARRFERLELRVTRQMVANYECGRNNVPVHLIPAIAHVLGVCITEIFPPLAEPVHPIEVRNDNIDRAKSPVTKESINAKPASDPKLTRHLPADDWRNLAGPKIRLFRKKRKWTQDEFAKSLRSAGLSITRDIIANIETQRGPMTDTQLALFARQLGVMPEALLPDRADLDLFIQAVSRKPQIEHPLHTRRKRGSAGNPLARASHKLSKISKWLTKLH